MFTSTVTSYAQFFRENETSNNRDRNSSGIMNRNTPSSSSSDLDNSYGGFFRNSPGGPGDRPGSGEGIGQEAPVEDGILVLVSCCIFLGAVKIHNAKRRKSVIIKTFWKNKVSHKE